ncbi:hypothetical protein B0H19DRAFT_925714, partial [Mycena capillaripes]
LAHYLLRNMRFIEGIIRHHIYAAVSLVISWGLHRIRSATSGGSLDLTFNVLAPPRDAIEECERIDAFWTVLFLNNCWTSVDGSPLNIWYTDPNTRINTPWPLDMLQVYM